LLLLGPLTALPFTQNELLTEQLQLPYLTLPRLPIQLAKAYLMFRSRYLLFLLADRQPQRRQEASKLIKLSRRVAGRLFRPQLLLVIEVIALQLFQPFQLTTMLCDKQAKLSRGLIALVDIQAVQPLHAFRALHLRG
jgi:hypothetical protein